MSGRVFRVSKNLNIKLTLRRCTLIALALIIGFSLAEPGITYALAENNKNQPIKSDYARAKPLVSQDSSKTTVVGMASGAAAATPEKPKIDRTKDHEDTSERTRNSVTYVNKDGSRTLEYSATQKNYQVGNSWQKIDNHLQNDSMLPADLSVGTLAMGGTPTTTLRGNAGVIKTRMNSFARGITMTLDNRVITMQPMGAANAKPVQKDERTAVYHDVWPGVDAEYELRGESVKETLIIKNKNASSNFDFAINGGKIITHPSRKGELAIEGLDPATFSFSALTVDVNGQGPIAEQRATQKPTAQGINISLDRQWLSSQPTSSFPIRVDPTLSRYNDVGEMYKSNVFTCNQTNCYFNTGMIAGGGNWYAWRSMFHFDYNDVMNSRIVSAQLSMPMKQGINGAPETRELWLSWANGHCFDCTGNGRVAQGSADAWSGYIDFRDVLQDAVNANRPDAWFMIRGVEQGYKTYKPFVDMNISVIYDRPTQSSIPITPKDGQVVVDTQATLKATTATDPDGPVKYQFFVSTSTDAISGAVASSGWIDTPQWTIPDDLLQDGTTYWWKVQTKDAVTSGAIPTDGVPTSFKIDLRTGKDSTQSYETIGPVGVDLATGNATLEASSHSMNALGGNIGLNLSYNTPNRAKKGLIGEYWNVSSSYNFAGGPPKDLFGNEQAPVRKVREQNIDFSWGTGAPTGVNGDWFYGRYTGQFVAPIDGVYQFGANNDDSMRIAVDGKEVYNDTYTAGAVHYGSNVTLKAGQVVSLKVDYMEGVGGATARLYVKGAVTEQVVPRDWLYSNVTNESISNGLMGRYYLDTGDHDLDKATQDSYRLMLARRDTSMNLQFGNGGPAAGMQTDNFMARWTGYITVPTSGKYTLGAISDDGVRIKTGTGLLGAMEEITSNSWGAQTSTFWGKELSLEANKPVPIIIDYMEAGGSAGINLIFKQNSGDAPQTMPSAWLSPKASALPDNWQLGIDIDGNVGYERLRASNSSVILYDSTGSTHEYTYANGGYKPPVNEDGHLAKNPDNTYTLIDTDGRTYIFDVEGKLTSLTTPTDDRKPAALKYVYEGDPSRLIRIEDGIDPSRNATLSYKGFHEDGLCAHPGGFDDAPTGMLCAIKTTDGDTTKFYYKTGQLARIEQPGNQLTDYSYDQYARITRIRDSLAADAVAASIRTDDDSITTQLSYDSLGRITNVVAPSATAGAKRLEHTFNYTKLGDIAKTTLDTPGVSPVSTPVSVSWGPGRIDLFARGTAGDLIHKWFDNNTWSNWESLGGCIMDDPAAASWGVGRLDVFVRGCNTSGNNIHHRAYFNNQWYGYDQPTNNIFMVGSPSVVSWGDQRLDYVFRGSDNQLYQGYWSASTGWGAPVSLGGCLSSSPKIISTTAQSLDVYMTSCDNDHTVAVRSYRGSSAGWLAFVAVPSTKVADIGVGTSLTLGPAVFVRHTDGSVHYTSDNGASWKDFAPCATAAPSANSYGRVLDTYYLPCGSQSITRTSIGSPNFATEMHVTGAAEPNGYSKRVEYDQLLRTVKETDLTGKVLQQEWDQVKDLQLSKTDATGLKSTTLYDMDDRATDSYGPAPSDWFGADRRPVAAHANDIPHTSTGYDEGINGLQASYFKLSSNKALIDAPLKNTTNFAVATTDPAKQWWGATAPVTTTDGSWGVRFTGKINMDALGTYKFRTDNDGGVRIYIDDSLVLDDWNDGPQRSHYGLAYDNRTTGWKRLRIDYYHKAGSDAGISLFMTAPGAAETNTIMNKIRPAYGLTTSSKAYDSVAGDVETKTVYKDPAYGTVNKTVLDPTGLNYESKASYEDPGTGFLRQTSKTLPGGATTTYQHYGATETVANPCVTGSAAVSQAGRPKGKVEPDPDGTGPLTGRKSETIYNTSGDVVATRYNADAWTCTEYDSRGRVTKTTVPARTDNGETIAARTITNNYAVGGNPLIASTSDLFGTITTENDLLGRNVKYTDARGNITANTYDDYGKLAQRTSKVGVEAYEYDQYDRLVRQKLDGATLAAISYDQFSRISNVDYGAAGQTAHLSSITRDTLGRENGNTYTLANSQTLSDQVDRYVSGDIKSGTELGVAKSYTYDKAGRLTGATIGSNTYSYGFGAQDTSCAVTPGYDAGRDGNRTSMTVNGAKTTYCYNAADQLTKSSDPTLTDAKYDTHGNTVSLGSGSKTTRFKYDTSDRNRAIEVYDSAGNGQAEYLNRDAQGRIIQRVQDTITTWKWADKANNYYGFTGSGDTPDFVLNASGAVVQKYITLPGDVLLTINVGQPAAAERTYSLPNLHGDIFATLDGNGSLQAAFMTGPFGEVLPSAITQPSGAGTVTAVPVNTLAGTTYAYVGQHQKMTETSVSPILGGITQMGARVYISALGRFLQVDPKEGGNDNNYAYVNDPVNGFDLDGNWGWGDVFNVAKAVVRTVTKVAEVASFIPGPIGMVAAGVAVAGNLAQGNWKGAAVAATGIVGFKSAGWLVGKAFKAAGGFKGIRATFGATRQYLRNGNNFLRIGRPYKDAHFRLSIGPANAKYQKSSRIPFNIHLDRSKGGINTRSGKSIRLWGNWQ